MSRSMAVVSVATAVAVVAIGVLSCVFCAAGCCLNRILEAHEAVVPELFEKSAQLLEPFRTGAIEPPRAIPPHGHEPRVFEHAQVLRDGRAGDGEVAGDGACR